MTLPKATELEVLILNLEQFKCTLCSWASLIAQLVKNPLEMQETPVRFLDQEDALEKG